MFVYHGNGVCIWESERKGNENGEGLLLKKITILESVLAVTQLYVATVWISPAKIPFSRLITTCCQ